MNMNKPNIILITLDAARADHFGFMGYQKNTSPFLDSLAKKGTYFTNAFSTGAGSPHSFVAVMTSTYPADYGGFAKIEPPRKMVSEVFQNAGYRTVGIHSAAYLSGYFGYDRGWDEFQYLSPFAGGGTMAGVRHDTWQAKFLRSISKARASVKNIPIVNWPFAVIEKIAFLVRKIAKDAAHYIPPFYVGEEMNAEVRKIFSDKSFGAASSSAQTPVDKQDKPLFLWVHYMDAHEPFGLFLRTRGFLPKLRFYLADILLFIFGEWSAVNRLFKNFYVNLYDVSLRYADDNIRDLFEYLERMNVINNESIVAFTSDHGEAFFEDGDFGHDQRPGRVHFHVPLIFYSPKNFRSAREDRPVSLIDLAPTFLASAGVSKPSVFRGGNMFDGKQHDIISQIIDCEGDLSNQKYLGTRGTIATLISVGKEKISPVNYSLVEFNGQERLFTMDDIYEKKDIMQQKKEVAEGIREQLKKYKPTNN